VCVFDSSPRWPRTLRLAALLAEAIDNRLVIDPGGPRRWLPRRAVNHHRQMARVVGAATLVACSVRAASARLIAPHRSPALATATGLPTVLVPEHGSEGLGTEGQSGTALVCGVDDSPAARAAVDVAARLSAQLDLPLHLVHAYAPLQAPLVVPAPAGAAPLAAPDAEGTAREPGWDLLERMERRIDHKALLRLRPGPAPACLDAYADLFDAPMIVIGAPRRGSLAAALAGSVAWRLTSRSNRPVMLVPEDR
jgi:nucleotide-binding universal stress UspA family protein